MIKDALLALRDLLIVPAAPPPAAGPLYFSLTSSAARAGFPAYYAAHADAVRNAVAVALGLLLLAGVLLLRALARAALTAVAAATGGEGAVRALEEEEAAEGTLPDNAFWAGTLARQREREALEKEKRA
jgi:hypothetical protein